MAVFELKSKSIDRLHEVLMSRQHKMWGRVINDVLHNEGGPLIEESVRRLMPVSGRSGNMAAKTGKSLRQEEERLSVTIRTTDDYHYLYFPDDGTNTRRHVGEQYFFRRGGEAVVDEIVERCIRRVIGDFEQAI